MEETKAEQLGHELLRPLPLRPRNREDLVIPDREDAGHLMIPVGCGLRPNDAAPPAIPRLPEPCERHARLRLAGAARTGSRGGSARGSTRGRRRQARCSRKGGDARLLPSGIGSSSPAGSELASHLEPVSGSKSPTSGGRLMLADWRATADRIVVDPIRPAHHERCNPPHGETDARRHERGALRFAGKA